MAGFLLSACANVTSVPGGPEDTEPPRVVQEKSTPNFQTNFEKQRIELTFDEWVELQDVFNQVVVSPPLENRLGVRLKGKRLIIDFAEEEILRPDATYTINFGEAVRDFNESNPAEDLRFVFSTGEELDSLSVSGQVVDAATGEPVEKALVLLYDQLSDTILRAERPFYFSRTNAQGRFSIQNIREDTFRVFALLDNNFNYRYDLPQESLAFLDTPIVVTDSTPAQLELRLFKEDPLPRVLEANPSAAGRFRILLNRPAADLEWRATEQGQTWRAAALADSLLLWHRAADTLRWPLFLSFEDEVIDTVEVSSAPVEEGATPLAKSGDNLRSGKLPPGDTLSLSFRHPLSEVDTSRMLLLQDSVAITPLFTGIAGAYEQEFLLVHRQVDTASYDLLLLPGALTDFFGQPNDTLQLSYGILPPDKLTRLTIALDSFPTGAYVLQLYQGENLSTQKEWRAETGNGEVLFADLSPGDYRLRIVVDRNGNGRWDPGRLDDGRQPETFLDVTLDKLRANWELVKEISWPGNNR